MGWVNEAAGKSSLILRQANLTCICQDACKAHGVQCALWAASEILCVTHTASWRFAVAWQLLYESAVSGKHVRSQALVAQQVL